jgi:hypothetical protein
MYFRFKTDFHDIYINFFPKMSNNIVYDIIQKDELEEMMKFIRMHIY